MNQTPIIDLENLCVFKADTILNNVSWKVLPGENWIILGANGAGKSTLLHAITAYDSFSGGTIRIDGHTYGEYNWPELRRRIGIVSAELESRIRPAESASDVILGGHFASLGLYDEPNDELCEKADAILERIGCAYLRNRGWGCLSQGEKRRVMIGRALMVDPILIILDEPCSGLDPVARERFLRFLQNFSSEPDAPSLVMTTHHVEDIMGVFTHLLALKNGRILRSGKIKDLMRDEILSELFDAGIKVDFKDGRYHLNILNIKE
ncbi:ATP-binding cassette domain-containing protein [bacterium]|nr:ATP-binding cassette domain-containing protein [bacterium]